MKVLLANRTWWLAVFLVALLHLGTVPVRWQLEGSDEIEYLCLAHSLVLGQGYTLYGEPHVFYPPLPSVLLSVVMRFAGVDNWRVLYGFNAFLGILALGGFGFWMRRRFGLYGIWASWFALISYYGWSLGTRFMLSEPLYLLLSMGAVALAHDLLDEDAPPRWKWLMFPLVCLLAAMTRSASISLTAAFVVAGGMHFLFRRGTRGLSVVFLACFVMIGFNAAWQIRAARVFPQAPESYFKWAKRFLGAGQNTASHNVVERNQGEGITPEQNRWPVRSAFLIEKMGQMLTGVPRSNPEFFPLASFLALLVAAGIISELRARPHSVSAWLVLISLILFSLTSWVSSYLRYLYTLLPLLFLYLYKGLRVTVLESCRKPAAVVFLLMGGWGLSLGAMALSGPVPSGGSDQLYRWGIGLVVVLISLILLLLGWFWLRRRFREEPLPPPATFLAILMVMAFSHTAALAAQRIRLTQQNASLKTKHMDDAFDCALWVRQNTPPDAWGVCSYPTLMRIMCGRKLVKPADCHDPFKQNPDFVINIGIPGEVPGIPWIENECLRQSLLALERNTGRSPDLKRGYASVYGRVHPVEPGP